VVRQGAQVGSSKLLWPALEPVAMPAKRSHGPSVLERGEPGRFGLHRFSLEGVAARLNHLAKLTSSGAAWRSCAEEVSRFMWPVPRRVVAILAVIAQQARTRRSELARAAIARLRAKVKPIGSAGRRRDLPSASRRRSYGNTAGACGTSGPNSESAPQPSSRSWPRQES